MAVQNHLVELNRGAGSPFPITIEFKRLRKSGRLASQTKRSYEAMQGTNKKTGNVFKKARLTASEPATDEPVTDKPVTDEPSADERLTDEPATDKPPNDASATLESRRS